tara:strand:+ start:433 stop:1974 length:1542 start_codon:yes stop_codon:yes gene_type:complete
MFNIIKNHIFHLDEILLLLHYKFSNHTHQKWWLKDKRFDEPLKNDISMCYDMLKDVSRSFSEVIIQLPNNISLDFVILYLRARALDTIEDDVTLFNGDLKKRKKTLKSFHKEKKDIHYNFQDEKYKFLMNNYSKVMNVHHSLPAKNQKLINTIIKKMSKGMVKYLDSNINTIEEYNDYCYYVAGLVGEILTKIAVVNNFETDLFIKNTIKNKNVFSNHKKGGLDKSMGIFLQKTNIIRDYREDIGLKKQWWPKEVWSKYTDDFTTLPDAPNSVDCINELINDNIENIPDVLQYLKLIKNKDYFRFCATPQIIALHTQALCYNNEKVYHENIKIRKGIAIKSLKVTNYKHVCHQFRNALNVMKSKINKKSDIGLITQKNIMIIENIISKEIGPEKTFFEKMNRFLFLLIVLITVNFLFYKLTSYFDPTVAPAVDPPGNKTNSMGLDMDNLNSDELVKTAGKLFGLNEQDIKKAIISRNATTNLQDNAMDFNIDKANLPSSMGMPMIFTIFGGKI